MALTLPYPTYTSFTAQTVHSYTEHNTPHAGLLSNDAYLAAQIDATNTAVAGITSASHSLLWIPPLLMYSFGSGATGTANGRPSEFTLVGATNTGHRGLWQTVSYPSTGYIAASGVASLIMTVSVQTASHQQAYIRLCPLASGSTTSQLAAYAMSTSNDDDSASDTNTFEMPYFSARQFSVYWNWNKPSGENYYWGFVSIVGYRTST